MGNESSAHRRWPARLTGIGAIGSVGLGLYPVASTPLRLGWIACLAATWLGLVILSWRRLPARVALLCIPVVVAIPFVLPARAIDRDQLRRGYVHRMTELEGTPYVWGGENALGIDCSGLPRHAMRQALFWYGIRNADGGSVRKSLELWWFDSSARALGEGYRHSTTPLAAGGTIASMDYSALAPGDLAVTSDGVHVLAFAGGENWIQADPGIGAVATLNGRTGESPWFERPVTGHRWSVLAE